MYIFMYATKLKIASDLLVNIVRKRLNWISPRTEKILLAWIERYRTNISLQDDTICEY